MQFCIECPLLQYEQLSLIVVGNDLMWPSLGVIFELRTWRNRQRLLKNADKSSKLRTYVLLYATSHSRFDFILKFATAISVRSAEKLLYGHFKHILMPLCVLLTLQPGADFFMGFLFIDGISNNDRIYLCTSQLF